MIELESIRCMCSLCPVCGGSLVTAVTETGRRIYWCATCGSPLSWADLLRPVAEQMNRMGGKETAT